MHLHRSPLFKGSTLCTPSPDGRMIAVITDAAIAIRSTETLQVVKTLKRPADQLGPVAAILWSPSSQRILTVLADQFHVCSLTNPAYHARVLNLNSGASNTGKPLVRFGATDNEVLVWSTFGLKLTIYNLATSRAVELSSGPKFYLPSSALRGWSIRSGTDHIAILTREGGKDLVSIHHPISREVQRSFYPDIVDAQGLRWTPDGKWLLLWESPAHGRRMLLYTPDGHLFRSLGPTTLSAAVDSDLEPGIRVCVSSPDANLCAVGDHGRDVSILRTETWSVAMMLCHPQTLEPRDTIQIWQEQTGSSIDDRASSTFLRATQSLSPPLGRIVDTRPSQDARTGCSAAAFDASSNLLATRLDESPSTVWIWDVLANELRAVLVFYSAVTFSWHPSSRELLLVSPKDGPHKDKAFVWDPTSNGPSLASLDVPASSSSTEKPAQGQMSWISRDADPPLLLMTSPSVYGILAYADSQDAPSPWRDAESNWAPRSAFSTASEGLDIMDLSTMSSGETTALDDTFSFRKN